jgi:paraquat-inducible protein B
MSTTDYNSNDRLVLQLVAQQQQLQQMNEGVNLILGQLHSSPNQPNLAPQLDQLNQQLAALNDTMSRMQKDWARREPRETLDAVQERLRKVEERSESTRETLKGQQDLLQEYLSAKVLGIQYGSIAILASLLSVMGVYLMPGGLRQAHDQLSALRNENRLLAERLIRIEKHLGITNK